MMKKVAVVGLNPYAKLFIRSILQSADARLGAVLVDSKEAEDFADGFGAELSATRRYSDLNDLAADPSIEGVVVCSPLEIRAKQAELLLDANKAVLVERPPARTLAEMDALIASSERTGAPLVIGHILRFWNPYAIVQQLCQSKKYGEVVAVQTSRVSGAGTNEWKAHLLDGASTLGVYEAHSHDVDLLLWMLRPDVLPNFYSTSIPSAFNSDGYVHSVFDFPGGVRANAEASFLVPLSFPLTMRLRVDFQQGCAEYTFRGNLWDIEHSDSCLKLWSDDGEEAISAEMNDPYQSAIEYFLGTIQNPKAHVLSTVYEGRVALELLLKIMANQRKGE